jgi:hypothetical protein
MPVQKRIFIYLLLGVLYYLFTLAILSFNIIIPIVSDLVGIAIMFILLNCVIAHFLLKTKPLITLITAVLIGSSALCAAMALSDVINIKGDFYGIYTAIGSNIIISLLLWEIAYHIKQTTPQLKAGV